jgi:hypothetical protein
VPCGAGGKEAEADGSCQGNHRNESLFREEFSPVPLHGPKPVQPFSSDKLNINFVIPLFSTIFELTWISSVIFCE